MKIDRIKIVDSITHTNSVTVEVTMTMDSSKQHLKHYLLYHI